MTPDAFTRWAQSNAIPQEYWHLCRQAWEAGAQDRQLTIATHLRLVETQPITPYRDRRRVRSSEAPIGA